MKNKEQLIFYWPLWRWILIALILLALTLSVVLSWHYLMGGSMLGCGGGSPCDQVLSSQWSKLGGVLPVSGLAVGVYLTLLVASFFIGQTTEAPIRRMAWSAMLVLVGSVVGSAIWFTILQKWIIRDFCPYCMTTHIIGLLLAALVFWRAKKEFANSYNEIKTTGQIETQNSSSSNTKRVLGLTLIGLMMAGIVVGVQIVTTPAIVYLDGESQNELPVIDYQSAPMIGSADAPYVVTLLFDYQCSHCQKIHFMLDELVRRYSGKLAFVLCPVPLNTKCNPYIPRDVEAFKNSCELAEIGMGVWLANREVFPDFENWMFTFESGNNWLPRSLEAARTKAIELVGEEKFDTACSDPWIEQYVQNCIQIYGKTIQTGNGGIPKLIFGSRWVIPEPQNADDLMLILKKSLLVPEP